MEDALKPIRQKIQQWLSFDENNSEQDLSVDTIFSLWRPFRFTLARINGYPKLNKIGDMNDKISFLKELSKNDLDTFLPVEKPVVIKLAKLFELGMTDANVMILPDGKDVESLNILRKQEPFHDYMPYFLHECFEGGRFEAYFANNDAFAKWIREQRLEMFFENNDIKKDKLKDLSGMGDYRKSIPLDMELMLENYIEILEMRSRYILAR